MNKKPKKLSLFDDEDNASNNNNSTGKNKAEIEINKGYADRYNNWRRLEEMQKIKDRYGEELEDSSSSESEPEWSNEHEEAFLKTLGTLKSGGKLDDGYFSKIKSDGSDGTESKKNKKEKGTEKMTIKDYERKLILEREGQIDESDEEEEKNVVHDKSYHQEQEAIRKSLAAAINEDDGDEEFLVERKKTQKEIEKEENDFYAWLKDEEGKNDKIKSKELKHLKKFWKDDQLDDSEKFLRDYIMNKDYEPNEDDVIPTYDEIVALDEDEKELERNRDFERKYNFRFENPDQDFIKQYPRSVGESMRSEDNKRKEKRQEREERKKKEKEEKMRELKQLQKMKKSEIEEKLEKLKKAAGCDIPLSIDELNADFDPKEFDKKMQQIFNDEYYGNEEQVEEDENEKPIFSDMEDSDFEDYDELDPNELKKESNEGSDSGEESDNEDNDETGEDQTNKKKSSVMKNGKFDMVAAAQRAMKNERDESRRKKKRNALKEALAKKKPLFNPKEKTFEEYFNEYYALDYEDIIGDQVTKFKYREVEPNSFGLSTEEILNADERQLNAWASLKKVTAYRTPEEENFDKVAYQRKARNTQKKEKLFATDFGGKKSLKRKAEAEEAEKEEQEAEEIPVEEPERKKKKKNRKRGKKNKKDNAGGEEAEQDEELVQEVPEEPEEQEEEQEKNYSEPPKVSKNRRKKNKNRNLDNVLSSKYGKGVTDSRVKAYGLNPNRLKKGLIYGSK